MLANKARAFVLVPEFNGKHDQRTTAATTGVFPDVRLEDGTQLEPAESAALEA